jgi:hypothetical protein
MGGRLKNTYIGSASQIASGIGGTWGIVGSTTLAAPATSITFSGLSGYTSYQMLVYVKDNANAGGSTLSMRFNGDAGNHYEGVWTLSTGIAVTTGRFTTGADTAIPINAQGQSERSYSSIFISNASATEAKPVVSVGGQTLWQQWIIAGGWSNQTDNITSIAILNSANMGAGTKVILLGSS